VQRSSDTFMVRCRAPECTALLVWCTRVAKSSIAHRCNQGRSTERINVSHWWSPTDVLRDFARHLVPFNLLRMRWAVLSRRQLRSGGHSNNCTEVRLSRRNGSNEYTKVWGLQFGGLEWQSVRLGNATDKRCARALRLFAANSPMNTSSMTGGRTRHTEKAASSPMRPSPSQPSFGSLRRGGSTASDFLQPGPPPCTPSTTPTMTS
jgi:hypothetical protein